ncbi:MAG: hypothetical protein O2960_27195 [Verrucomicrobia bacterium]|nr:hypothetical protein [Verrucomicrobiota bacterium]
MTANLHQARTFAALRDTLLPKLLGGDSSDTEPTNEMEKIQ